MCLRQNMSYMPDYVFYFRFCYDLIQLQGIVTASGFLWDIWQITKGGHICFSQQWPFADLECCVNKSVQSSPSLDLWRRKNWEGSMKLFLTRVSMHYLCPCRPLEIMSQTHLVFSFTPITMNWSIVVAVDKYNLVLNTECLDFTSLKSRP